MVYTRNVQAKSMPHCMYGSTAHFGHCCIRIFFALGHLCLLFGKMFKPTITLSRVESSPEESLQHHPIEIACTYGFGYYCDTLGSLVNSERDTGFCGSIPHDTIYSLKA